MPSRGATVFADPIASTLLNPGELLWPDFELPTTM